MSKESFLNFMKAAASNEDLARKVRTAQDFSMLQAVAKENGFDIDQITEAAAKGFISDAMGSALDSSNELSDTELDAVAGGGIKSYMRQYEAYLKAFGDAMS